MSAVIGLEEVFADPVGVARDLLAAGTYGLTDVRVARADSDTVILWLTLEPWAEPAAHGYPTERVSIAIERNGRIRAIPIDHKGRRWEHVFSDDLLPVLCLWDPEDPPSLQWIWTDGFIAYVTIVHRHLQAEECWRRHGIWPGEDAPHGAGPHPILTPELRAITSKGA